MCVCVLCALTFIADVIMLKNVCALLDIEAFQHRRLLFYREFAWAPIDDGAMLFNQDDILSHNVTPKFIPSREDRDVWRTFNTLKYKIHGLDLCPDDDGSCCVPQEAVKWIVLAWYETTITPDHFIVAYKGGNLEKDLLNWLQIPSLNLEDFGCPSFHSATQVEKDEFPISCGQHRYALNGDYHCPIKETAFYRSWVTEQLQSGDVHKPIDVNATMFTGEQEEKRDEGVGEEQSMSDVMEQEEEEEEDD